MSLRKKLKQTDYCRACLNDVLGLSLERRDCVYDYYIYPCSRCGEVKHIVRKLRVHGTLRYFFDTTTRW